MGERLFEEMEVARLYQQHRLGYDGIGLQQEILSFMSQTLKQVTYSRAVDVGCGTGFLTRLLAPHFSSVVGIDISEAQIQAARDATKDSNVEYKVASAEDMSLLSDNSAELVAAAVSIQYFQPDIFLKEVDRILMPGGCLAIIRPKSFHLTPDTDNKDIIERFTSLFNEFRRFNRSFLSHEASEILDKGIQVPYSECRSFTLTTKRSGNIEIFSGFANTLGGVRRFRREQPCSEDVIEKYKTRFLEILSEISTTPENVQVTLSCPLQCCLYRKSCTEDGTNDCSVKSR